MSSAMARLVEHRLLPQHFVIFYMDSFVKNIYCINVLVSEL